MEQQIMRIIPHYVHATNVHPAERLISVLAGIGVAAAGFRKKSVGGIGLAIAGIEMVRRGVTGHSFAYEALGVRTAPLGQGASISVPYELGVRVDQSIVIHRPPEEVYRYWRNLANLPKFMAHVESVEELQDKRSHWKFRPPHGHVLEWDAVIHNELENELIAWRTLPGADVDHAGSVWFKPTPDGQATEVRVEMQFNPPGGAVGAALASFRNGDPEEQLAKDLRKLKEQIESRSPASVE
jgi:uncharacterized membrane protein